MTKKRDAAGAVTKCAYRRCHHEIQQSPKGRPKLYCDDNCRQGECRERRWEREHTERHKWRRITIELPREYLDQVEDHTAWQYWQDARITNPENATELTIALTRALNKAVWQPPLS